MLSLEDTTHIHNEKDGTLVTEDCPTIVAISLSLSEVRLPPKQHLTHISPSIPLLFSL